MNLAPCKKCGKQTELACALCKTARYCSTKCQTHDWSFHKELCEGRIMKEQLNPESLKATKTSIKNSFPLTMKWLNGTSLSFNIMVIPKEQSSDDNDEDGERDPFSLEEEEDEDLIGDDDTIALYTEDPKYQELKIQLDRFEGFLSDMEEGKGTTNLGKKDVNKRIRELTSEIDSRKLTLVTQKKVMEYFDSGLVDYYINEEAFAGGPRNFYLILRDPEPYNSVLAMFKDSGSSSKSDPIFNSKMKTRIIDYVKTSLMEIPSEQFHASSTPDEDNTMNDSKGSSDGGATRRKKKLVHSDSEDESSDEEKTKDPLSGESLMKGITSEKIFFMCSDPKVSKFMTRNNIRYSSLRNIYLLLKQLEVQNGKNSLENAGSIRSFAAWKSLGFSVKKGQKILRVVIPKKDDGQNKTSFGYTPTGFDESQLDITTKDVMKEYKKQIKKDNETLGSKDNFITVDDIPLVRLTKIFRKDHPTLEKNIVKKIGLGNYNMQSVLKLNVDKKSHSLNLDIIKYDLPNKEHNTARIVFHILAHFLLDHDAMNITEEQDLEAEAVALLTCNMVGIAHEEYYKKLVDSITGPTKVTGFSTTTFKKILTVVKKIIEYANTARTEINNSDE